MQASSGRSHAKTLQALSGKMARIDLGKGLSDQIEAQLIFEYESNAHSGLLSDQGLGRVEEKFNRNQ
jgi:hypothetical protein